MINARVGRYRFLDQFVGLFGPAVEGVRRRRWRCLWLGPAAASGVACLALLFRTPHGHAFLLAYAITRPGDRLATTAVKLPLSMFAPAALLPFWFALAQVGIVYSVGQSLIGARRTIVIAVCGHTLGTFSAGVWIALGHPLGVGRGYAHLGDAGPSVAVIAVIAYIVVIHRVGWLAVGMIVYHAVEVGVFNGLAQREHLIGTLTGVVAAAAVRVVAAGRVAARPVQAPLSAGTPGSPTETAVLSGQAR